MASFPRSPSRQFECNVCGPCAAPLAGLRWHHLSVHGRGMALSVRRSRWKRRRSSTGGSNSGSGGAGPDTNQEVFVTVRRVYDSAGAGAALRSDNIDEAAADTVSRAETAPVEQPEFPLERVDADAEPGSHGHCALEADERGGYYESANRMLKELFELTRTDRAERANHPWEHIAVCVRLRVPGYRAASGLRVAEGPREGNTHHREANWCVAVLNPR